MRKISDAQARLILAAFAERRRVQRECSTAVLARKFNCSMSQVLKVAKYGMQWREVDKRRKIFAAMAKEEGHAPARVNG